MYTFAGVDFTTTSLSYYAPVMQIHYKYQFGYNLRMTMNSIQTCWLPIPNPNGWKILKQIYQIPI